MVILTIVSYLSLFYDFRHVFQTQSNLSSFLAFLPKSLPTGTLHVAVVYGLVGTLLGALYADGCLYFKSWVRDRFQSHEKPINDDERHKYVNNDIDEAQPLKGHVGVRHEKTSNESCSFLGMGIAHEPTRAGVAGILVGIIVGVIGMFLPHSLFWGEAQLQVKYCGHLHLFLTPLQDFILTLRLHQFRL